MASVGSPDQIDRLRYDALQRRMAARRNESYTTNLGTGFDADGQGGSIALGGRGGGTSVPQGGGGGSRGYDGTQDASDERGRAAIAEQIEQRRLDRMRREGQTREDTLRSGQWSREDQLRQQQWAREDRLRKRGGQGGSSTGGSIGGLVGDAGAPFDPTQTRLDHELRMKEQRAQHAFLREQAAGRQSSIDSLIGRFNNEVDPAEVDYQGPIQAQEDAARGAAFARAKEMAAMNARASMSALEDTAADQGFTGSTMQAGEAGRIVGGARADVHDFIRGQQISDTDRAKEVANMRYQGGITQRGQTMGRQQSRQQAILSLMQSLY